MNSQDHEEFSCAAMRSRKITERRALSRNTLTHHLNFMVTPFQTVGALRNHVFQEKSQNVAPCDATRLHEACLFRRSLRESTCRLHHLLSPVFPILWCTCSVDFSCDPSASLTSHRCSRILTRSFNVGLAATMRAPTARPSVCPRIHEPVRPPTSAFVSSSVRLFI